jgi:transcriptional regulator with XRE-family HTH domain
MSNYGNSDLERARRRRNPPTALVLLLEDYNAMLGWTQLELAKRVGKDTSDLNKIFTGEIRRPHKPTLERIAQAYQEAGLNVTAEFLAEARDRPIGEDQDPFGIPPQWLRLVRRALSFDEDIQDDIFALWQQQIQHTAKLLARKEHSEPRRRTSDAENADEADHFFGDRD